MYTHPPQPHPYSLTNALAHQCIVCSATPPHLSLHQCISSPMHCLLSHTYTQCLSSPMHHFHCFAQPHYLPSHHQCIVSPSALAPSPMHCFAQPHHQCIVLLSPTINALFCSAPPSMHCFAQPHHQCIVLLSLTICLAPIPLHQFISSFINTLLFHHLPSPMH